MALRNVRIDGDPVLRKKARKVEVIDDKIKNLLEDMVETMYDSDGVGLACPQIGILLDLALHGLGDDAPAVLVLGVDEGRHQTFIQIYAILYFK